MIREIPRKALNGILALLLLTAGSFAAGALVISGARQEDAGPLRGNLKPQRRPCHR